MVTIGQAEIWWAELPEPEGSAPGYRRPVLILQSNALNQSNIGTVLCMALTSNLKWSNAPGNVLLDPRETGLRKESLAVATQIWALPKTDLIQRVGRLPSQTFEVVLAGLDVVLGR